MDPQLAIRDGALVFWAAVARYEATHPKAIACLTKDREVPPAFDDFPAELRVHIHTTKPIESTLTTVLLRHYRRKRLATGDFGDGVEGVPSRGLVGGRQHLTIAPSGTAPPSEWPSPPPAFCRVTGDGFACRSAASDAEHADGLVSYLGYIEPEIGV
ncbi:MAG: hypothetical protein JSV78_01225 [Phycisphaerales bacterium]|nr:MAG: hypothetical protein JSV78_01225 [Phycisphaerales bacterium]